MGHPPQAVWLPARGLAHLAPGVERIESSYGATPGELAALLRARPRGEVHGQLASIAWVFDAEAHHVLLVDHRVHGWSCPGGHVETREEPLAAAVRELAEETGLALIPDRDDPVTLTRTTSPADAHGAAHDHWILGYRFTADRAVHLAAERDTVDWHPVDDLPSPCVEDLAPLLAALAPPSR